MKYIYNKINIGFAIALMMLFACQDDDSIPRRGKPTISVEESAKTLNEGETAVFDFTIEYAVNEPIFIRIDVLDENGNIIPTTEPVGDPSSGNGYAALVLDDINVPYNTWFDSGFFSYGYLGGSGYVAEVPAYAESFQLSIDALLDAVADEAPETYTFRLSATSTMAASIEEEISITINNVNACAWTLETFDAFGDGWNGGFITATINGVEATYAASGLGSTFEIGMVDNDVFSFTYTSGGGSGQAPGWEEENTYILTAPDGTVFSDDGTDGTLIAEGEITSGTNLCPN